MAGDSCRLLRVRRRGMAVPSHRHLLSSGKPAKILGWNPCPISLPLPRVGTSHPIWMGNLPGDLPPGHGALPLWSLSDQRLVEYYLHQNWEEVLTSSLLFNLFFYYNLLVFHTNFSKLIFLQITI